MEKILLQENEALAAEICKDLKEFLPVLNELKQSFEKLELEPFSDSVFKELVKSGPTMFVNRYVTNLNTELDRLQITSALMRGNAMASHSEQTEGLKEAVRKAKVFKPTLFVSSDRPPKALLSIDLITYSDAADRFYVSDDSIELIMERHCRIYAQTEQQVKFLGIVLGLKKAFDEYRSFLDDQGILYPAHAPINTIALTLSSAKGEESKIKAGSIISICKYKAAQEEYNRQRLQSL